MDGDANRRRCQQPHLPPIVADTLIGKDLRIEQCSSEKDCQIGDVIGGQKAVFSTFSASPPSRSSLASPASPPQPCSLF